MADQTVQVQIGADTRSLEAALNVITSKTQGYSKELVNALNAANLASNSIPPNMAKAASSTEGLTVATAGATREFIVLGHEVVSGNFSRIPGSLIVLAERMGGLKLAVAGLVGAFGAVAFGVYEWVKALNNAEEASNSVMVALRNHNQELSFNHEQVEANITGLKILSGESTEAATKIVESFSRAGGLSVELKQKLLSLVVDFAAAAHTTLPTATEEMVKMFQDPSRGLEEYAKLFPEKVSPAQIRHFQELSSIEEKQKAILDLIEQTRGSAVDEMGSWERAVRGVNAEYEVLFSTYGRFLVGNASIFAGTGLGGDVTKAQAEAGGHLNAPSQLSEQQKAAAELQEKQNQLNIAYQRGLEIEKEGGLEEAKRVALTQRLRELKDIANKEAQAGDYSTQQRFLKDAEEVQRQIDDLRSKGEKQDVQAAISAAQEKINIYKEELIQRKDLLDAEVDAHKITKLQEIQQLKAFSDIKYEQEIQEYEDELNLLNLSVVQRQRINNEIEQLQAKHTAEMLRYDAEYEKQAEVLHNKQLQSYKPVIDKIGSSFDSMLNGVLQGTQSWQQAMGNFFLNMAATAVESIAKIIVEFLAFEAITSITGVPGTWSDFMTLYTGKPGGSILGFASGSWEIPQDQLAMIHQGEMIIPAAQASAIRSGDSGIGGTNGNTNVTINLNAIDTQTGTAFLKANAGVIAQTITQQMRNNNRTLINSVRG